MSGEEEDSDLYDELIEQNRIHIVKVISPKWFYDPLRTQSVLTATDCEEIEGNRTRWQKAGSLLDILRTKGNNGVQKFLGILEFEHPECYRRITKKEPRNPPAGYLCGSNEHESQFLTMIDRLPQIARDLTKDYQEKKDLTNKLKKMTDLLQLADTEKQDMERDNESLRRSMNELKQKVACLEKNLAVSLRQVEKLKDESMEYLKNSLQLTKERDHYRDRWQTTQMEKDEQERQNQNLKEQYSTVKDELARTKRESASLVARAVGQKEPIPDNKTVLYTQTGSQHLIEQSIVTREQILKEERDEIREKCEELTLDLDKYRQESEEYQRKYTQEKEQTRRLRNVNDQLEKFLKERTEKTERYFIEIKSLEQEKKNIEEEKHKEQVKREAESEKRRQLFEEKHSLEKKFESLKTELERLRVEFRNSKFSVSDLPETDHRSSTVTSSDSDGDHERPLYQNSGIVLWTELDFSISQTTSAQNSLTFPKTLEGGNFPAPQLPRTSEVYQRPQLSHQENIITSIPRRGNLERSPTIDPQVGWSFRNPQSRINEVDDPFRDRIDTGLLTLKMKNSGTTDRPEALSKKETVPITSSASETSEDSNTIEFADLISYEVLTNQLPPIIVGLNDVHLESQCFTIIVTTPVLGEKFDVVGGNYTGIYVSKLHKNIGNMDVGDQILMLVYHNTEDPNDRLTRDLKGYTREEIKKLLDRPPGTEIEMQIKHDPLNYDLVKKWMENNQSQGDSFFIRSNINCDSTNKVSGGMAVNSGNIFHVTNTLPVNQEKYWQAFKYNQTTGHWSDTAGFIPSGKEARKFQRGWSHEDHMPPQRNRAFRYRSSPYLKVLPTRATSRMPVLLFGKEELIEAIRDLLVHESEEFISHDPVRDGQEEIRYILQQDKHLIFKNPSNRAHPTQNISLCIGIEKESNDRLKQLFDRTFDCSDSVQVSKSMSEKLEQQAVTYNVLIINCTVIRNKQSLLQELKDTISKAQERIVWLSEKHLDPTAVDKYSVMLMCERHAQFSSITENDMYTSVESYSEDKGS